MSIKHRSCRRWFWANILERPRGVVAGGATFERERLVPHDLDLLDVVAVPQGLQDAVGEAWTQNVSHGLLAEEMVDPEDRPLGEGVVEQPGRLSGRPEVFAEGFLHDDPAPLGEAAPRASMVGAKTAGGRAR